MDIQKYVVVSIMVAVYLVCEIIKPFLSEKQLTKWLPLIAGLLGIGFNAWVNAGFSFDVFLNGLASGLSATGLNQLIRQSTGYYDEPLEGPVSPDNDANDEVEVNDDLGQ